MKRKTNIQPNVARMWDYVMGGHYNFVVDRTMVRLARRLYPLYEESMWAQRGFLQRAMTYMVQEQRLDNFIDFGSGLPTQGNVHEVVQAINPDAKVIYSDSDHVVVTFGQEILGGIPSVRYVYCDAMNPDALFDLPVVAGLFDNNWRVGIGFVGIFLYIPNQPLSRFFSILYDRVAEGSYIAVTYAGREVGGVEDVVETSRNVELRFYARSDQEALDLIGPWKLAEPGIGPGFYWGLPEDSPEINPEIQKLSRCFVAYK